MSGLASGAGVSVSTTMAAAAAAAAGRDVVMGGTTLTGTPTTTTTTAAAAAAAAAATTLAATLTATATPTQTSTPTSATTPATVVSASLLATAVGNSPHSIDQGLLEARSRCSQCGRRRTVCHHPIPTSPSASANAITTALGSLSAAAAAPPLHSTRPRRISKLKHRLTATFAAQAQLNDDAAAAAAALPSSSTSSTNPDSNSSSATGNGSNRGSDNRNDTESSSAIMDPPVLSFYGKEPVPLPTRFAHIKHALVEGHEKELEASWARLIDALRDEVDHIASRGPKITPTIDFADINSPDAAAAFARDLKRYGVGLVRGVVPRADAQVAIDETVKYLENGADFKEPTIQDPTCFDLFWTPAQVRTRAHPRVMEAQRFAMSLWDHKADDRMAIRFPIAYGDRLRIHGANIGSVGPDAPAKKDKDKDVDGVINGDAADGEEARRIALELLGDFASSTVIAQVDNGSLERWEPDGYGRGGTYASVFRGAWEKYDPWDPTFRVSSTPDLYNGHGACSIFRMFQGVVALSTIEPGLIRLLPSPKLATAYFLLRPFFSPKTKPPERRDGPEWEAFLDASNWSLDRDQTTIIHGAVPGHAQRLTELWHPHLHLRRTLVTIPTLQTGDYIIWHPDLAYHITSNPNVMASRAPTPPPALDGEEEKPPGRPVSILVYVPAAPLTQTNALYLARQRKTFQRGHPAPDFDATGSGLGSEKSHADRPGETVIAQVGGPAALQAMGLAPFDVAPTPPATADAEAEAVGGNAAGSAGKGTGDGDGDVAMDGGGSAGGRAVPSMTRAEAEVARLANIILFPDRYDFYMAKRNGSGTKRSKVLRVDRKEDEDKEDEDGDKKGRKETDVKAEGKDGR